MQFSWCQVNKNLKKNMPNKLPIKILTILIFLIILVAGYANFFDKDLLEYLVTEDNILEDLTALTLLFGGLMVFYRFFKYKANKPFWWKFGQVFLGCLLLFGFAEEISWGQRIIGFETPKYFQKNNKQWEVGIHNLEYNGFSLNQWIFSFGLSIVLGVYYLLSRWLSERFSWIGGLIKTFGIPLPEWFYTFLLLLSTVLILFIQHSRKWEIYECLFVLILIMSIYAPFNYREVVGDNSIKTDT